MENYKENIIQTRLGCLGSSDAPLLAQIDNLGIVPRTARRRLAVAKGLAENKGIPLTAAVKAGDEIEMAIYSHLKAQDDRYESNPLWVSRRYSKDCLKLISHPDIVLKDEAGKVLHIYEVKTTKFGVEETRRTYNAQLYVHHLLGREQAETFGDGWRIKVYLVHYSTEGLDLESGIDFDPKRLTIKECRFTTAVFNVDKAMTIANEYVRTLDFYSDEYEVDADLLPVKVKAEFDAITTMLAEIKQRETRIDEFKKKLYLFMLEKDIKAVKGETFSITRVDPTTSRTFDAKKYLEDYAKKYPRKVLKIRKQYEKVTNKKGFVTIKVRHNEEQQ